MGCGSHWYTQRTAQTTRAHLSQMGAAARIPISTALPSATRAALKAGHTPGGYTSK